MAMNGKQHFTMHPALHPSSDSMRRVCLPAPQVRFTVNRSFQRRIVSILSLLSCSNVPPSPTQPLLSSTAISLTCLSKQSCSFHINFYDMCFEVGAWECSLIRSWHNSPLTSICALLPTAPGQYIQRLWWESPGPRWSFGGGWHCKESRFQDGRHLPYHEQRALHLLVVHGAHISPIKQPPLAPSPPPPEPPDLGRRSTRPPFF